MGGLPAGGPVVRKPARRCVNSSAARRKSSKLAATDEEVGLLEVVRLPFIEQRPTWLLPGDGEPSRAPLPQAPHDLLLP